MEQKINIMIIKIEGKEKFMILLYLAYDNDVTFIVSEKAEFNE